MTYEQGEVLAESLSLDLIEISSSGEFAVFKIGDFGKYKYEQDKKRRKLNHYSDISEIRFRSNIAHHDKNIKIKKAKELLKKNKVRLVMEFKGRSIAFHNEGAQLLRSIVDELSSEAKFETEPIFEGKRISVLLTKKKEN